MNELDLSIIVPVYNVEKYLKKCLDSLINLDINNYEILLINDGSTDKSLDICNQYQSNYSNIFVINQVNKGLSETRNVGIRKSRGKYLYFIDSDDYIDSDTFVDTYNIFLNSKADIILFGYYQEKDDMSNRKEKYSFVSKANKLYSSTDFLISELKNRNLPAAVCFGIYKKSLIIDNDIFFEPGIYHEDERWSPQILFNSKKIYLSSNIIYHYIQRDGSIMHKKDRTKNGIDLVDTSRYLASIFSNIENKKLKKYLNNKIAMLYLRGAYVGKLYRFRYRKKINRLFPIKHTCCFKDYLKSILFFISPYIYYLFARVLKGD